MSTSATLLPAPQALEVDPAPSYAEKVFSSPFNASVVGSKGFIRRCPMVEIHQRWLPHMTRAVGQLKMSRNSISFCLTEEIAFIRPPWSRDQLDPGQAKDGLGGGIKGFINIVSTSRQIVKDVKISLVGTQTLAFGSGSTDVFEEFRRELSLSELTGCGAIELEKGINVFEFVLLVPKTTPTTVYSQYGRLRFNLRAEVPGSKTSSFLKGRLVTEREMYIVGLPERSVEDEMRFDVDEQSNLAWSGQSRLEINSERLTIGEPVSFKFTMASPPANLTVFGIHAYILQTVVLRSPSGDSQTLVSPKRTILKDGFLQGWARPDFVKFVKTNKMGECLFDGTSKSGQKGECWKWAGEGVLPVDNTLKPTTIYYSDHNRGLTFAHQLVVDVFFQQEGEGVEDERLMVASMYKRDITIASTACIAAAMTLPTYAPKNSERP